MTYLFSIRLVKAISDQLLFLLLQIKQLLLNLRIHEISNILAVHDFRDLVVLPLGVVKFVELFEVDVVHAGAAIFGLDISLKAGTIRVGAIVLNALGDSFGDARLSLLWDRDCG